MIYEQLTLFETPLNEINVWAYFNVGIYFNDFAEAMKKAFMMFNYKQLTLFKMENDEYKK